MSKKGGDVFIEINGRVERLQLKNVVLLIDSSQQQKVNGTSCYTTSFFRFVAPS